MTDEEIRTVYLDELARIAPDVAPETVGPDDHLQDDLGLDSMDVLNLVTALHEKLGLDIPEADYPEIATVSLAVDYIRKRTG